MHVKCFIEKLENMFGSDEFMDEEMLEILQEIPFQEKEIQTSFLDIHENSQQLIVSSLAENVMSQSSNSISCFPFVEGYDNL